MSTPQPFVEQPLGALVLTCGSAACGHTFEPDPDAFAAHRLSCPRCGGWAFQAVLIEPTATAGGVS